MKMSDNFFCVFCTEKIFFKKDFKEHVFGHNNNSNKSFEELVDELSTYCSQLEFTLKRRKKNRKMSLPDDNVDQLFDGCPLCKQIITHYKLKTFNRSDKPERHRCICDKTKEDECRLTSITCSQCQHFFHYECYSGDELTGEAPPQLCDYCEKMDFVINTSNDIEVWEQLIHVRHHLNYRPYECRNSECGLKFCFDSEIVEHLRDVHKHTDPVINGLKKDLVFCNKIDIIEEILARLSQTPTYNNNIQTPNKTLPSTPVSTPGPSTSHEVMVQTIGSLDNTANNDINASKFSIPRNKLPEGLPEVIHKEINLIIELSERKRNIFDNKQLSETFDNTLEKIVIQCRKVSNDQKNQIYNYLHSNVRNHIKQEFEKRFNKYFMQKLESEIQTAVSSLKRIIERLRPDILKKYDSALKEFKDQQNKGKAEVQLPLKVFPFTEQMNKQLNDLIALEVQHYTYLLARNQIKEGLKEFLNLFIDKHLVELWPKGWMKSATLQKFIKPFLKSSTSPQKTEPIKQSLGQIPVVPKILVNGNHVIESKSPTKATSPLATCSKSPSTNLSLNVNTVPIPSTSVTVVQSFVDSTNTTPKTLKVVNLSQKQTKESSVVSTPKRVSQTMSSSAHNSEEPVNKKPRNDSNVNKSEPKKRKTCDSITQEEEDMLDKALEKVFDGNRPSTSRSSQSSRRSSDCKHNLRRNLNNIFKNSSRASSPSISPTPVPKEVFDSFNKWMGITKVVKTPYFPQMSDEVIYLRAGHHHYMKVLRSKDLISSTRKSFKTHRYTAKEYKEFEYISAKVKRISFESNPLPSITLKLEELDPHTNEEMNTCFYVTYLKFEEVPDFIILRKDYQYSLDRNWQIGQPFKTAVMDGECWAYGAIINRTDFVDEFPESHFNEFYVNCMDNTYLQLSPWNLEPINDEMASQFQLYGGLPPITLEERRLFYEPKEGDWPFCSTQDEGISTNERKDFECDSIEKVFNLLLVTNEGKKFAIASLLYPEPKPIYIIDLLTIRDRIHNRFYRRWEQIEFDLTQIETNLAKDNEDSPLSQTFETIFNMTVDYLKVDFWSREQNSFMDIYYEKFPQKDDIPDDDIQEIPVQVSTIIPNVIDLEPSPESTPTPETNEAEPQVEETKPIKIEKIEPKTEPPEDSKQGILESVSTPVVNRVLVETSTQTENISCAECQTQTQPFVEPNIDGQTQTETQTETDIESKSVSQIQTETQTEIVCNSEGQTQTVCETFHCETQTETTNSCQKSLNDSQTQTDTQNDSNEETPAVSALPLIDPESECYLCVFCSTNTYFLDKNQAIDHYKEHLGAVIQCNICYATYDSVPEFRSHDSDHLEDDENKDRIKQLFVTIDWIDSFLDFQITYRFNKLVRTRSEFCPVCTSIRQMSAQTCVPLNPTEDDDSIDDHIRRHFKHFEVFECIKCTNDSNGQYFKFFFDSSKARTHLRSHESVVDWKSTKIETHFRVNETINKKLFELYIEKCIALNKTLQELYES